MFAGAFLRVCLYVSTVRSTLSWTSRSRPRGHVLDHAPAVTYMRCRICSSVMGIPRYQRTAVLPTHRHSRTEPIVVQTVSPE